MTLRLILTRHAKSSWDSPTLSDHDRPLNNRGRRSADAIGKWMSENGYIPDVILCSTATRTVETWQRLQPYLNPPPELELNAALYHAHPAAMMRAVAKRNEACVLLIGHNPGIAELAELLVRRPPEHEAFFRYPTASTCVLDFERDNWPDALNSKGDVVNFVVPRDLI